MPSENQNSSQQTIDVVNKNYYKKTRNIHTT